VEPDYEKSSGLRCITVTEKRGFDVVTKNPRKSAGVREMVGVQNS
jgi:hypothetical protein